MIITPIVVTVATAAVALLGAVLPGAPGAPIANRERPADAVVTRVVTPLGTDFVQPIVDNNGAPADDGANVVRNLNDVFGPERLGNGQQSTQ